MSTRAPKSPRGAAITELALVLPILITIFLFGMFFAELVRAKLKMLEAARYTAFEMTSYTLDDYGNDRVNRNDVAFTEGKNATVLDTQTKFADLDSVDTRAPGGLVAGFSGLQVTMENKPVTMTGWFSTQPPGQFGGRFIGDVLGALDGTAANAHQKFGFNRKGQVSVDIAMRFDNRMLPRHFLDDSKGFFSVDQWGGSNLQSIQLHSKMSMVASGWQLTDGADAQMQIDESRNGEQAGLHRTDSIHGLWLQVKRMSHLGLKLDPAALPGVAPVIDPLSFVMPEPFSSAYVTAHNYGLNQGNIRGCDQDPSHPAPDGMNNLDQSSVIDSQYRKCYETAPFRDQAGYDSNDGSLQVKIFMARGAYFMGCQNAQAEDPTHAGVSWLLNGDVNSRQVQCGGEVQ